MKVGDKVRIIAKNDFPESGFSEFYGDKAVGLVGEINSRFDDYWIVYREVDGMNRYLGMFLESELELVDDVPPLTYEDIRSNIEQIMEGGEDMASFISDPCYPYWMDSGLNSEPKKMSLSKLAKRILDKDTRTLVKAGILDSELDITEEGAEFLLARYLADNKKELAAEAKKLLEEEEE